MDKQSKNPQAYEEMGVRQRAHVDAIAESRLSDDRMTRRDIAERAGEIGGDGVESYHHSYISEFESKHGDIIDERVSVLANEREEHDGEVVTLEMPSASYQGPPEGIDTTSGRSTQLITERPVKETQAEAKPAEGETEAVAFAYNDHPKPMPDDDVGSESSESDSEPAPDTDDQSGRVRIELSLTGEQAYQIIRTADDDVARALFDQLTDDR